MMISVLVVIFYSLVIMPIVIIFQVSYTDWPKWLSGICSGILSVVRLELIPIAVTAALAIVLKKTGVIGFGDVAAEGFSPGTMFSYFALSGLTTGIALWWRFDSTSGLLRVVETISQTALGVVVFTVIVGLFYRYGPDTWVKKDERIEVLNWLDYKSILIVGYVCVQRGLLKSEIDGADRIVPRPISVLFVLISLFIILIMVRI